MMLEAVSLVGIVCKHDGFSPWEDLDDRWWTGHGHFRVCLCSGEVED